MPLRSNLKGEAKQRDERIPQMPPESETGPDTEEGGKIMQARGELNRGVVVPHKRPSVPQSELQKTVQPRWWKRGVRLMAEEGKGGLLIPYPLLAIIVPVVIALIAMMGAMYSAVNNLQSTMLMRDAQHAQELREVKEKQEQAQVYIQNDREKIIELKGQIESLKRRGN